MMERTLVLVKPDGVYRALIGKIVNRFEEAGLKVVAIDMVKPDRKTVERHYNANREWLLSVGSKAKAAYLKQGKKVKETEEEIGMRVRGQLVDYLANSPVVAMVVEGNGAISIVRKIVGGTEPKSADPGSIRGSLSSDSYDVADERQRAVKNLVHASENREEAEREIAVWFKKSDIVDYKRSDQETQY